MIREVILIFDEFHDSISRFLHKYGDDHVLLIHPMFLYTPSSTIHLRISNTHTFIAFKESLRTGLFFFLIVHYGARIAEKL